MVGFNSPKLKKFVQFLKDYGYIFLILIAIVVYFIINLGNNNKPTDKCPSGSTLSNLCGTSKCIPKCNQDEFYACDLNVCVPNCDPKTSALAKCGKDYKCVPKDQSTTAFGIPAFDDTTNCTWLSGFNDSNCKLYKGSGENQTFYEDCIDYKNKYGQVLFGKDVPNDTNPSFKCGLLGSQNKDSYYSFDVKQHKQGYNTLEKGKEYTDPFYKTCDSKSSFADLDLTQECINANNGMYKQDGNLDTPIPDLDFCGYDNGYCKHNIDCTTSKNFTWRTYATINNCKEALNAGKTDPLNASRNCEIPEFMFPTNEKGSCEPTSLPTNYCTTGDGCPDWIDSGFKGLEESCTYDIDGYSSYLRPDNVIETWTSYGCKASDGNACTSQQPTPGPQKGCRASGDPYAWNGTQCVTKYTGDLITGVSDVNVVPILGGNYGISNMTIQLDTLPSDKVINNIITNPSQFISNVVVFIADASNGTIDKTSQLNFEIVNDAKNYFSYNNDNNIYVVNDSKYNKPFLISKTTSENMGFKLPTNGTYYMGLIISLTDGNNSVNIKTKGFDLSNEITNITSNTFNINNT